MILPTLTKVTMLPTVLYLDDEPGNRQAFKAAFRKDFNVLLAGDLNEAWQTLIHDRVHVMISDQRLRGAQGSEILQVVRERFPLVRRMLMTGYSDIQTVIDAINMGGVSRYITKPWDHSLVVQAVTQAYGEYRQEEERVTYVDRLVQANQQLEFALRQRLLS